MGHGVGRQPSTLGKDGALCPVVGLHGPHRGHEGLQDCARRDKKPRPPGTGAPVKESPREVSGAKSQEPAWGGEVSGAMETGVRAVGGLTLNLGEWWENDHRASGRSAKGIGGKLL